MTATHAKARGRRFPRLAALFGHDDARPMRYAVPVGMPGHETAMYFQPEPAPGKPQWERAEPAASPVHMVGGEITAIMPCCGMRETQVPQTDYVTANPRLVTCRTSAHDTMPDDRASMARSYVPEPRAILDIFADIRDLPVLRDAIRATTQRGCTECGTCGRTVPGWDWQERFAAQLAHVAYGQDARSNGTGRAAEPAQDEAVTEETEQAA